MKKILHTLLILPGLFIFQSINAQVSFSGPTTYTIPNGASPILSADFNNDGFADIALAEATPSGFTIRLNDGHGGLGTGQTISLPEAFVNFIAADFNSDNLTDIAVITGTPDNISTNIYLNSSTSPGTFTLKGSYSGGSYAINLKAFDYNNDGSTDLVYATGQTNIALLKNDGQGAFSFDKNLPGGDTPYDIAIADLNGDGYKDIALMDQYAQGGDVHNVKIFINQKDGNFTLTSEFNAAASGRAIAAADFNKDGKIDLAVTSPNETTLFVFTNDGAGNFIQSAALTTGQFAGPIAMGDFDSDGFSDLATALMMDNLINIYTYSSTTPGNFTAPQTITLNTPWNLISADFNNDGKADLAATGYDGTLNIYLNTNTVTLPVSLSIFTGSFNNAAAELNWSSGVEGGFSYYEIERSADGAHFVKIGQIPAKGSNSTYHFSIAQTISKAYYRLRTVFNDNNTSYSDVVTINRNNQTAQISLSPNPAHDFININLPAKGILNIYNASGKLVKKTVLQKGKQRISIQQLSSGIYYAEIGNIHLKFIKY